MVDINNADGKQLSEMKAWFFKENVRIMQEKQKLEEERREFEKEKRETLKQIEQQERIKELAERHLKKEQELFEKKLEVLQRELRQLACDRQQLEKEKAIFKEIKGRQSAQNANAQAATPKLFFKGVNSQSTLRKRYKDLIKIFHPDNLGGDTIALQSINQEYDSLKKVYSI